MDNALIKDAYASYQEYPLFAYNCVAHLINDSESELLWKILYYNDRGAWRSDSDHPNLTADQKRSIVYAGQKNQNDFRVFLDIGMDNAITEEICILRISPWRITPVSHIVGITSMAFEVYSHFKINTMSNYETRVERATQLVINSLNGTHINGLGRLYFNSRASSQCGSFPIGHIPFRGRRTIMCNKAS